MVIYLISLTIRGTCTCLKLPLIWSNIVSVSLLPFVSNYMYDIRPRTSKRMHHTKKARTQDNQTNKL